MMNPKDTTQDPPSELNVFEDWYIEDENGNKKPIFMPGMFEGGTYMSWRWKRETV